MNKGKVLFKKQDAIVFLQLVRRIIPCLYKVCDVNKRTGVNCVINDKYTKKVNDISKFYQHWKRYDFDGSFAFVRILGNDKKIIDVRKYIRLSKYKVITKH